MDIAARIYRYREARGLSQEQVAKQLGITRESISQWEAGETAPNRKRLDKLAQVLGVSPSEILFGISVEQLPPDALKMLGDWNSLPKDVKKELANKIHTLAMTLKQTFDIDQLAETIPPGKIKSQRKQST